MRGIEGSVQAIRFRGAVAGENDKMANLNSAFLTAPGD